MTGTPTPIRPPAPATETRRLTEGLKWWHGVGALVLTVAASLFGWGVAAGGARYAYASHQQVRDAVNAERDARLLAEEKAAKVSVDLAERMNDADRTEEKTKLLLCWIGDSLEAVADNERPKVRLATRPKGFCP